MKFKTLAAFLIVAAAPAFAAPAMAQEDGSGEEAEKSSGESLEYEPNVPAFDEVDQDGDGQVTTNEAQAVDVTEQDIDDADLNADGALTKMEWNFVEAASAS